jgi:hypothetical protein
MPDPTPAKQDLRVEVLDKVSALVTAAFGLVAALAWNDAIKALVAMYLGPGSEFLGLFTYAVIVTVLAVVAVVYIGKAAAGAKEAASRASLRRGA